MKKASRRPKGSYLPHSDRIGFQEWTLDAKEEFEKVLNLMCKEAFEIATAEYECNAWFPIEWSKSDGIGGKVPDDPTTVYVCLPIGPSEDDGPTWSFALSDLVDSIIELNEIGNGGPIDDKAKPHLAAVRDDLRRFADRLDAAMNRKE